MGGSGLASERRVKWTFPEYRGRITSVYTLVYAGTGPLGYMFAGATADRLGANMAFSLCGAAAIALIVLLNMSLGIKGKRKSLRVAILEGNPRKDVEF